MPKDSSQEIYGKSSGRLFNLILEIINVPLRSLRIPARLEGKLLLHTKFSDLGGDFDTDDSSLLDITYYVQSVELEISRVGNDLEISWNDNGVLQIAASVDGPRHDVNLQSSVKLQRYLISSILAEFFRACVRSSFYSDGKEGVVSILSTDWGGFVGLRNRKARPTKERSLREWIGLVGVLPGRESFKRHRPVMWIGQSSIIAERESLVGRH